MGVACSAVAFVAGRKSEHTLHEPPGRLGCRQPTYTGVGCLPMAAGYQNRIELLQGTLDLLILQTMQWGSRNGYGISQATRTVSADALQVDTGSLYPALHRLERQKWIRAEWTVSERNQRARVYQLTAAGRKQLLAERSRWEQISAAIAMILERPKASRT